VSNGWSQKAASDIVYCRAGGRRRYNAIKQLITIERQNRIIAYMISTNDIMLLDYGFITRLARLFGVSRQTIHRDISAMFFPWRPQSFVRRIDVRLNYERWWEFEGKHCDWWKNSWFGQWWNSAKDRHQNGCRWKSLGNNNYGWGLPRSRSRKILI
jgi:hypothetical protein